MWVWISRHPFSLTFPQKMLHPQSIHTAGDYELQDSGWRSGCRSAMWCDVVTSFDVWNTILTSGCLCRIDGWLRVHNCSVWSITHTSTDMISNGLTPGRPVGSGLRGVDAPSPQSASSSGPWCDETNSTSLFLNTAGFWRTEPGNEHCGRQPKQQCKFLRRYSNNINRNNCQQLHNTDQSYLSLARH